METDRLKESHEFLVALGMRPIFQGEEFAVLELRAGTHLVLMEKGDFTPGDASFDLMVEDLDATHARLDQLGFKPSEIAKGKIHNSFTVSDPSGSVIKFNSDHSSDKPV